MSLLSEDAGSVRSEAPLYYQGKYISGMSMSSDVDGLFDSSLRPAVYGTLTAADAGSRGLFQLPGGNGGVPNGARGVFNLPRYYPKYKSYKKSDRPGANPPRRGSQTLSLYGDDVNQDEPVYAKPNKSKSTRAGDAADPQRTLEANRGEIFTVVDGFDAESMDETRGKQQRRRKVVLTVVVVALSAIVLVAVVTFLAVYFTTPTTSSKSSGDIRKNYEIYTVLRINSDYRSEYRLIDDNTTLEMTMKICEALKQTLTFVNLSTGVATWANNCSAVSYSEGSIIAVHRIAMTVTSATAIDDVIESVNATLTNAISESHRVSGVFYKLFNSTVDLTTVSRSPPSLEFNVTTSTPAATSTLASMSISLATTAAAEAISRTDTIDISSITANISTNNSVAIIMTSAQSSPTTSAAAISSESGNSTPAASTSILTSTPGLHGGNDTAVAVVTKSDSTSMPATMPASSTSATVATTVATVLHSHDSSTSSSLTPLLTSLSSSNATKVATTVATMLHLYDSSTTSQITPFLASLPLSNATTVATTTVNSGSSTSPLVEQSSSLALTTFGANSATATAADMGGGTVTVSGMTSFNVKSSVALFSSPSVSNASILSGASSSPPSSGTPLVVSTSATPKVSSTQ